MAWGRKTKIEFAEKSDKIDQLQSEIQRLTQENTELQLVISSLEGLLPEQSGKIDEQESAIQRLTQEISARSGTAGWPSWMM
jgi:peptidoglycan hydrolase CwlO-like protein